MNQSLLKGKHFFKESRDILQKLLQVGQIKHVFKTIDLHLILFTETASHDVEEVRSVLELGKLSLQELYLSNHLLCLALSLAFWNLT